MPVSIFQSKAALSKMLKTSFRLRFQSAHKLCTYHAYIQFDSTQVIHGIVHARQVPEQSGAAHTFVQLYGS